MTDEEQVRMRHDWLIAEFQLVCGAILAVLAGVIIAALAGQLNPVLGVMCTLEGAVWLVFAWRHYARRAQKLRDSLKSTDDFKGVD